MNRIILTIIYLVIICVSAWAQQIDLDKLKAKAEKENTPTTYNQLAAQLIKADQIKEAKEYATQALTLATTSNDQKELATANQSLGQIAQSYFDYTNAVKYYLKAQDEWRNIENEVGIAQTNHSIGTVYYLENEYSQALSYLNQAAETYQKKRNRQQMPDVQKTLGDVYYRQNFIGKAKDSYSQAFDLYVEQEQYKKASGIARFLGTLSLGLGEYDAAMTYFSQSLDLNGALEDLPNIAIDYNNMATTLLAQGNIEEAKERNKIAFDLRTDLKDTFGLAETHKNAGLIALAQKNKSQAVTNLQQSTTYLKDIKVRKGVPEIYEAIEQAYVKMGQFKEAHKAQAAVISTNKVLLANEKAKALYELTVSHNSALEAEKKEKRIALLEKDQSASSRLKWFLFAVIGLIASLFGMLFFNFQRKKKANTLLTEKNEEIRWQTQEIDRKNTQLEEKAASLDLLNSKLIDEMAERESMEKSSFARDSFLAMMSHEMRTPINIIVGLTHLLLEDNPHDSQKEALRKLQFSANNLVVFINDVLDYSKIEAGKLVMQNRAFGLEKVIAEVRNWSISQAKEKNVELNFDIDNKIPKNLVGDPVRLNQILTDLISNSLNYTEDGFISTKINLHQLNGNELTLLVEVSDNGKGIEQDKLEEMFKNFTRDPNADLYDGVSTSGLELAITKRLVDLQNGKIEATSELGKGNLYKMFLPFKALPSTAKIENEGKKVISYNFMVGKNVLVVEDNKINQLVVKKMLLKIGMKVTTANDGLEALDVIEKGAYFDLILMDIQMPRMDGYRTTAEIRKSTDLRVSQVPIIALTASAYLSEKEKAQLFGMDEHVGKPFGPDELMEKISTCLSKKRNKIKVVTGN